MKQGERVLIVAALSALIGGCATPLDKALDAEGRVQLDPELERSLAAYSPLEPPGRRLLRYSAEFEENHSGLAQVNRFQRVATLNYAKGFVLVNAGSEGRGRQGTDTTLCGLVRVLGDATVSTNSRMPSVIPAGKTIIYGEQNVSKTAHVRSRLVRFDADVKDFCAPRPGMEFALKFKAETAVRGAMPLGIPWYAVTESTMRCKVDKELVPASVYHAKLTGEVLPARCLLESDQGAKIETDYLYLRDAQFYLPLHTTQSFAKTTGRLLDVEQTP